jgi:hypothetical protein
VAHKKYSKNTTKPSGSIRWGLILLGVILVITSLVYLPNLDNDILYGWDDGVYLEDEFVKELDGSSVTHFFSEYYLGMYQPLAVLSLSIDHQLYEDNSAGYHATNFILHLLNIVLSCLFVYLLTKKIQPSVIVSLLFAIHPMQVEAVSWIAARSALLFTIFYLAALISYLRYLDNRKWTRLSVPFLFFIIACFSKSMAVTLPLILLLLDYFRGRKFSPRLILEKIPFLAASIVFGIVSINAAGSFGHIENLSSSYNVLDRIFLLTYGISFYLFKSILPVNLSAIYSYPIKESGLLPLVYYFSPVLIIAAIGIIYYWKKYRKELIFGLLFFLLSIFLVLPFYWSRVFIVAERYSYLTYLGIYFLIAHGISKVYDPGNYVLKKYRPYLSILLAGMFLFYLVTAMQRARVWKNPEVLLTDVIEKPHDESTHSYAYYYRGNYRDMVMELDGALADYNNSIRLYPGFILAYNNRGIVKGMMNDLSGALTDFTKAIELKPDYADAWYNRGLANFQLGNIGKACEDWERADELGSPSAAQFHQRHCLK